ncbi:MAG TPA: hypothetical protein VKC90_01615 [Chitinophagaceae bacterium]|nr:hypothetical protein [Chitinophagaceae bacterium]
MLTAIFIVFFSLIPLLVTLITSPKDIFIETKKKERREIFKQSNSWKLSFRGWAFLISIILTAVFAYIQQKNQVKVETRAERKIELRDSLAKVEQNKRDSIAEVKRQESNNQIVSSFGQGLAKYGLKYDSSQKIIEKLIKDSTKRTITILNRPDPYFDLCVDSGIILRGKQNDYYSFEMKYCSSNADSKDINFKIYTVFGDKQNNLILIDVSQPLANNLKLQGNTVLPHGFKIRVSSLTKQIYFLLKGKYFNSDKSKSFDINVIYSYNIESNSIGLLSNEVDRKVREFLQMKNVL